MASLTSLLTSDDKRKIGNIEEIKGGGKYIVKIGEMQVVAFGSAGLSVGESAVAELIGGEWRLTTVLNRASSSTIYTVEIDP